MHNLHAVVGSSYLSFACAESFAGTMMQAYNGSQHTELIRETMFKVQTLNEVQALLKLI